MSPTYAFQITERCSLHFEPTDFRKSLTGRRYLMDDAIPSIFPWSTASPKRKSPRKQSQHPSSAAEMPFFGSVNKDSDFPASDEISDLCLHIAKLKEQIKSLQQDEKRRQASRKPVWNNKI